MIDDENISTTYKFDLSKAGAAPPPPPKGGATASTGTGASASQQTSSSAASFTPTPFEPRDPTNFPRRQFLYGRQYARKYVSTTVAGSDVGKTTLVLTECLAMASGKPLLGVHFKHPLRIWYWNGEDPREEMERGRSPSASTIASIRS
jgi:hypothetical protein